MQRKLDMSGWRNGIFGKMKIEISSCSKIFCSTLNCEMRFFLEFNNVHKDEYRSHVPIGTTHVASFQPNCDVYQFQRP